MEIGILAKTFSRPSLESVLEAVAASGFRCMQFNLACAGLPSLPSAIEDDQCVAVAGAVRDAGLEMSAISGTFNIIDPDASTGIVTLCTGTRDPEDMWRYHPDNDSPEAWADMIAAIRRLCEAAEQHGVTLGIEPEVVNVVDSASKAARAIEEVGSDWLKVVIDPANLFVRGNMSKMAEVIEEAMTLLGPYIVLAHAKDIDPDDPDVRLAAGRGCLDYGLYLRLLIESGYRGPLILHGLSEEQVGASVDFVRRHLGLLSQI
jgi:sugar phosphate isomerase/epimerase